MVEDSLQKEVEELKKRLLSYVDKSISGEIVQCKKMIQAMIRFKKDLKRKEFYMDWEEVYRFKVWSSMFKHTKGKLAGQYIELHDSQLFETANILGFKRTDTGYRRYREAYIQKARKNAKTQELALIASYIAVLSPEQEEVYIAGWSKDQSNLCYNEIVSQLLPVEMLKGQWKETYNFVTVLNNHSTIKALSREARRKGDGTNPSLSIIDEWATAHETREIVDVQNSGVIARTQPLTIYITTAGFDLSFPAYEDYCYYSEILDPDNPKNNDDIFIAIYELDEGDDIKDEKNWVKANPIVATYEEGLSSIRSALKVALDQPSTMRNFLTKNMNLWVDRKDDGYVDMSTWKKQLFDGDLEEFLDGSNVYLGVDLSTTTDLTSVGWVAVKEGKFLVGQHSFMPEDKFMERMSRDKVRFDLFVDNDLMTLTPGAVVDYSFVKAHIMMLCRKYNVREVGFDMWNATHLATEILNEGIEVVEVGQSITKLSEPTKGFREKLYKGDLYHTDDPLLSWAINNAVVVSDANENIKINKAKSKERIDPIASVINAYSRAMFDDQTTDVNESILADDWTF